MSKNVLDKTQRSCTGCGACQAACPHDAIKIKLNDEGFFSPFIDAAKCVDCGLCQKVCYKFLPEDTNTTTMSDKPVYGTYSSNEEVHFNTTSGGFAFELSRWGIEHGYKIVGVKYDYSTNRAKTIIICSIEELKLLTGSKYIQSDTSEAFVQLIHDAKKDINNKYICVGTPCQIFGLRQLITRKRLKNDFVLVDLFCHGVPSYLVWEPHILEISKKVGGIKNVNFRFKGNGWHQYSIKIKGDKKDYTEFAYNDPFYRYFFDNIVLNSSCFTCYVRKEHVAADLRLGDFLGKKYEYREDGVSAVLVATEKGAAILKTLQDEKRIIVDNKWEASACLQSQSTHDYANKNLRDAVIGKLKYNKTDYRKIQRWYFRQMPLSFRFRSIGKRFVSKLPKNIIIFVRKLIRSI